MSVKQEEADTGRGCSPPAVHIPRVMESRRPRGPPEVLLARDDRRRQDSSRWAAYGIIRHQGARGAVDSKKSSMTLTRAFPMVETHRVFRNFREDAVRFNLPACISRGSEQKRMTCEKKASNSVGGAAMPAWPPAEATDIGGRAARQRKTVPFRQPPHFMGRRCCCSRHSIGIIQT
ncbi:hypothetical protein HPB52_020311 [Rhipicephalus sanguineus]|uniref:Uncharacterized protein n=1 Tax=Rhipicephalus sanguineus TaxID=34632 RepID=A0A9D4PSF1_RHISA|nr:hypothetical protein HPB52_020311 [Rhipicephalus sanguineus]